MPLAWNSILFP